MPASTRHGSAAAAMRRAAGGSSPVVFEGTFAALSVTQSFATAASPSGSIDLSPYAAKSALILVVTVGFYTNGGGAITTTCKYNAVNLTSIPGATQTNSGSNAGVQLWYMLVPPTTGALTLAVTVTGTSNTGRTTWVVADVYSNVGSVDGGANSVALASGGTLSAPAGTNQYAVNGMASTSTAALASYNQTARQGPTSVGGVSRFICGDAAGDVSGSKSFSSTGATYNSAVARLLPAV